MRINIFACAKGIPNQCAFNCKTKFFVQSKSRFVIGVYLQFNFQNVQPIVREIDSGSHERRANSLSVMIIMDRHPYATNMATSGVVRESVQSELSHQFLLDAGHKPVVARRRFC